MPITKTNLVTVKLIHQRFREFLENIYDFSLRRKLEESEAANQNLQLYVTNLKKSYNSVFAANSDSKEERTEDADTSVPTSQIQE